MGRILRRPLGRRNRGVDRAALRSGYGVADGFAAGIGGLHVDFDGSRHRGVRAHDRVFSTQVASRMSDGDDMVRQARLPAPPQTSAISTCSRIASPPRGLETTI